MNKMNDGELGRHIDRSIISESKGQHEEICAACGATWISRSFNFYGLCQDCFEKFDAQKMSGRFSSMFGSPIQYYESSEKWIKARYANR